MDQNTHIEADDDHKKYANFGALKIGERIITFRDVQDLYEIISENEILDLFNIRNIEKEIIKLRWHDLKTWQEIGVILKMDQLTIASIYNQGIRRFKNNIGTAVTNYKNTKALIDEINKQRILIQKLNFKIDQQKSKNIFTGSVLDRDISCLDLIPRAINALNVLGIKKISDLFDFEPKVLLSVSHFGEKSLLILQSELLKLGVTYP